MTLQNGVSKAMPDLDFQPWGPRCNSGAMPGPFGRQPWQSGCVGATMAPLDPTPKQANRQKPCNYRKASRDHAKVVSHRTNACVADDAKNLRALLPTGNGDVTSIGWLAATGLNLDRNHSRPHSSDIVLNT